MNVTDLMAFLKQVQARPRKSLSQNFLIDSNIIRKTVQLAEVQADDTVLEIGPGPGALTKELLDKGARVLAIEMDRVFARELNRLQNGKLTVMEADFLEFPLETLPSELKIVANLPYHITTPILEKIFTHPFISLTIMVQKEVADRMHAKAGTKNFSSLTLFVQFYTQFRHAFQVGANCFYPAPKVESTVIRLDRQKTPDVNATHFFNLVHRAFQQRRKMLSGTLPFQKEEIKKALATIRVREDARPEMLTLDQWVALARQFSKKESADFLFKHEKKRALHLFDGNKVSFLQ